jgi:hypothetical protein
VHKPRACISVGLPLILIIVLLGIGALSYPMTSLDIIEARLVVQ